MHGLRMVPVRRVSDPFQARVIAARLGSIGLVTQLRGSGIDGVYPFGYVEVLVQEDDLETAREVLLADEVESAFDDGEEPGSAPSPLRAWTVVVLATFVVLVVVARVLDFSA